MKISDSTEQPGGLVPSITAYLIKNPVPLMSGFTVIESNFTAEQFSCWHRAYIFSIMNQWEFVSAFVMTRLWPVAGLIWPVPPGIGHYIRVALNNN